MAKLIYSAIASADGYVEDAAGSFDWAAPSEDLHRFVNDLERRVGTSPYGRPVYETTPYRAYAPPPPGHQADGRAVPVSSQAAGNSGLSTQHPLDIGAIAPD